ncbi:MAG: DUF4304 domain-containing protein [Endomicrobium sp.]|jgi:hypothetical protein|nr:DUF4304 domain-containing protein [Endomicrobium sp.]
MSNSFINKLSKLLNLPDFARKNCTWIREYKTFFYIFNIQISKFRKEDFTINIGIFVPDVNKLCWGKDVSSRSIKETDCCLRGRLSLFFDTKTDWFTINNEADIEKVGDEINNLINTLIVPFFQSITSLNDIYNEMIKIENKVIQKDLHQIYLACLEIVQGKNDDASVRLNKINNTIWKKKADEILSNIKKNNT